MFGKQPPPAPDPVPAPPSPVRRFTDSRKGAGTVIGPGTSIKGELQGGDSVDLAGTLEGPSRVEGFYRVREGGRVVGSISAADVLIEGEVRGRLVAGRKVEIGAASRVHAHIRASVVAIAEGAHFEGQIDMPGADGQTTRLAFQEKRKRDRGGEGSSLPPSGTGDAAGEK
jgi:cytoskeletal protein CcmA (bactofilin family)